VKTTAPERSAYSAPYLAAGFLLLVISMAVSIIFALRESTNDEIAQNAMLAMEDLTEMISTVTQADDALRGYLITGSPAALRAYDGALAMTPAFTGELASLSAQDESPGALGVVTNLADQKCAELERVRVLIETGNRAAATMQVASDMQMGTLQQLTSQVETLRGAERRSLAVAQAGAIQDSWALLGTILAAMIVAARLTWMAFQAERTHMRRLKAADVALRETNLALEAKVVERTGTLHASEARFRLLAELLPGIVYMAAPDGTGNFLNREACTFTGLNAPTIHESTWMAFVHPDDLPQAQVAWEMALARSEDFEMEFRLRRHDGVYRWFMARTVAVKDVHGVVTGWIGTATDIDDRKAAEAALTLANADLERQVEEHSADLDRIFTLSSDIITVSDSAFQFLTVSPAWTRILGRDVKEALNASHLSLVHADDLPTTLTARLQLMLGQPCAFENRFRHADGSWRWLSWRMVPVPGGQRIYGVARDITAERARDEQLRQSQKMEVVGQLTGGVAHDFNNLLTIVMGSLELLGLALRGQDALVRRVDIAVNAAQRGAALVQRLMAFSRQQPLEPKPLDVRALLEGMRDMLHRTLGEAVVVELVAAPGLWSALADANQLENAILNLAVNARDAMPGGGCLRIAARNTAVLTPQDDLAPGEYVVIVVSDTGSGMPPEVQAHIFEPFFTTKAPGQGTGLGLAQVYGFIKQSDGHVTVHSTPGEGTAISLYLPRARIAELPAPPSTRASVATLALASAGNGAVALVVEDEPGVRQLSAEVLSGLGYTVLQAQTVPEALRVIEETPRITLLFSDVVLGAGHNGLELDAALRQRHRNAVVLFTSGYARGVVETAGRREAELNFIAKPFTAAMLTEKVGALFAARH